MFLGSSRVNTTSVEEQRQATRMGRALTPNVHEATVFPLIPACLSGTREALSSGFPSKHVSCTVYYWRERREEFNWLWHGLIPVSGAVLLIPILVTALGAGGSLTRFAMPLPYPISLTGPILLVWYSVGVVYLLWLTRRYRERLQLTASSIFGEHELPVPAPGPGPG